MVRRLASQFPFGLPVRPAVWAFQNIDQWAPSEPRTYMTSKFPGDVDAAGLGTTFEK